MAGLIILWCNRSMAKARLKSRYRLDNNIHCIDLTMNNSEQLFDNRDPAPFRERDLDEDAVSYIMSSIRDFPLDSPCKLVIKITKPLINIDADTLANAIRYFFAHEADHLKKQQSIKLRQGQIALVFGLCFLIICLGLISFIPWDDINNPVTRVVLREGLTIVGWVALWRPIDQLLYSWWPYYDLRRYYNKLANIEIEITH